MPKFSIKLIHNVSWQSKGTYYNASPLYVHVIFISQVGLLFARGYLIFNRVISLLCEDETGQLRLLDMRGLQSTNMMNGSET